LSLRLVGNSQARRLIQFSKFTNLNEMIYYLITLVLKRPLTRRKTYRNSTKEKFLIKAKIKTAHTVLCSHWPQSNFPTIFQVKINLSWNWQLKGEC
jgi:hypothetical protein